MTPTLDAHQKLLGPMLVERRVVPLLGAGANRCGRPPESAWTDGYLPDGRELSRYLAQRSEYPGEDVGDLLRVSQYIAVTLGPGALYEWLHEVFDRPADPNPLHHYLAALPAARRRRGIPPGHVIVTTTDADALERAFTAADEPFDVVTYIADGEDAGRFLHRRG